MAKKGTAGYFEWLRKYREHRQGVSKESINSLDRVRNILEQDGSYNDTVNGKELSIVDDGENYTVSYDGKQEKFDSSLGVVTKRLEDKILGIFEKRDIAKAKKGTKEYDEWLRKYREKKGVQEPQNVNTNTLKYRRKLAGIDLATVSAVESAMSTIGDDDTSKTLDVNGAKVVVMVDKEDNSTIVQVKSNIGSATRQAYYVAKEPKNFNKLDCNIIATQINKIINSHPDEYLPKATAEESN